MITHMGSADRDAPSFGRVVSQEIAGAGRSRLSVSQQTGIPYTTLCRILDGHGDPSASQQLRLARAIGMTPSEVWIIVESRGAVAS